MLAQYMRHEERGKYSIYYVVRRGPCSTWIHWYCLPAGSRTHDEYWYMDTWHSPAENGCLDEHAGRAVATEETALEVDGDSLM